MLTLGLALSVMATSVSASKFVDAHGNEVELDDTLEAYSSVVLSGADNAARKAETNLGDLWTDALRWFAVSGKINAYFDEDDVTAGNTKVDVDADHIVALWNGGNLRADIAVGKFGAAELAAVLPLSQQGGCDLYERRSAAGSSGGGLSGAALRRCIRRCLRFLYAGCGPDLQRQRGSGL